MSWCALTRPDVYSWLCRAGHDAIANVFWGVVVGIITSALLFTFGVLVAKVILPWYQSLIYGGVDLRWLGEKIDSIGAKYRYDLSLYQNAQEGHWAYRSFNPTASKAKRSARSERRSSRKLYPDVAYGINRRAET